MGKFIKNSELLYRRVGKQKALEWSVDTKTGATCVISSGTCILLMVTHKEF